MQLEPIPCSQAVCGLLGVGMHCPNTPETGFYDMDDSETQAQRRFSWSLTGTLSMCLQAPSQPLPRHSKPDVPHWQPPVPAPLPAVLGLAERRYQHHGQQQPAGPGARGTPWGCGRRAAAFSGTVGAFPVGRQRYTYTAVPGLRHRTRRAQTPLPDSPRTGAQHSQSEKPRVMPEQGGAGRGGGEEAARAEQSRGWRSSGMR